MFYMTFFYLGDVDGGERFGTVFARNILIGFSINKPPLVIFR